MHTTFDAREQTEGQPGKTGDTSERRAKTFATKSTKRTCPQDSSQKEGENDESTNDYMEIDPASERTYDSGHASDDADVGSPGRPTTVSCVLRVHLQVPVHLDQGSNLWSYNGFPTFTLPSKILRTPQDHMGC